jgi:hypothetical protein
MIGIMKKEICLFVFCLLPITKVYSQPGKNYPVFVLNDSFSHVQPTESKIKPKNFQLYALQGFTLNCAAYDFSFIRTLNEGKNPDAIFIIAKSGKYIVELNTAGETVVDKTTMQSLDYPKRKFKGFEKDDTPIIGIGTLKVKDGAASMATYWISMIDVK